MTILGAYIDPWAIGTGGVILLFCVWLPGWPLWKRWRRRR